MKETELGKIQAWDKIQNQHYAIGKHVIFPGGKLVIKSHS